MSVGQQRHRNRKPNKQRLVHKRIPWVRLMITVIIVGIVLVIAIFNIQASLAVGILGLVISLLQWLLPISQDKLEHITSQSPQPSSFNTIPTGHPMGEILSEAIRSDRVNSGSVAHPGFSLSNASSIPTSRNPVFLFNEPLTDSDEFYGRARECITLINRVRKGSSTSIVGPRKIGKTWLMTYLGLVAHTEISHRINICYIDASMPSCKTVLGFTSIVLEKLGLSGSQARQGLVKLEKVVRDFKLRMIVPVICIDEFEGFSNRQEFDIDFYKGLRALTQLGLCLVVASKSPLIDIVGENGKTSGFFNVFEQINLKSFDMKEAEEFVQAKGKQAIFTEQEQMRLLQYGKEANGYLPIRLQLVGKLLLEDKDLAVIKGAHYYRPNDSNYWVEFEIRLTEKYKAVVQ